MALTDAEWMSFVTRARLDQPSDTPAFTANGIKGRFIRHLVDKLVKFWGEHRNTLIPFLTQLAIAALDALVSAQTDIDAIDPPGPR